MSTASDWARVFVEYEEKTYSLFTTRQQAKLRNGEVDTIILKKLATMSYHEFEYESLFLYFEQFLRTLPGWWTPDTIYQFNLVRKFVTNKKNALVKQEKVSIYSTKS